VKGKSKLTFQERPISERLNTKGRIKIFKEYMICVVKKNVDDEKLTMLGREAVIYL